MPETIITKNLVHAIDSTIERARIASEVDHPGLIGTLREIFLANLIRPLLPEGYRAGTGKMIDQKGNLSPQTDVIIYDRQTFSPLMFDEATGIFPVDSVAYAIEVKSVLSSSSVKDAIAKASAIRALTGRRPIVSLFGFSSDTENATTDLDRVSGLQPGPPHLPPLAVYCSVGRGYAHFKDDGWNQAFTVEKRAEVVGFLIGTINTLVKLRVTQSSTPPGAYLAWWE